MNDLVGGKYIFDNKITLNKDIKVVTKKTVKDFSTEDDLNKIFNQKKTKFNNKKQLFTAGFVSITLKEFENWANKTNRKCHYCGLTNDESKLLFDAQRNNVRADGTRGGKRGKRLELDRKNPNESYDNLDNLVWCCYWCNNAKSNFFTEDEFKPIGNLIGITLKQIIRNI